MSDEHMSIHERRKYLKQMQKRYQAVSRGEKGKLLDEMAAVTGQHRKGLIRLMNGRLERRPRQRQRVALLGRSYVVMRDGFQRLLSRLPFHVLEIHPDKGSEFLNDHLLRFWRTRVQGLRLSRSQAWQKNDHRFVEQKNDTLVRAYLGYDRLDTVEQTRLLNDLYDQMWPYYNFFQPILRLQEKVVRPAANGHGTTHPSL